MKRNVWLIGAVLATTCLTGCATKQQSEEPKTSGRAYQATYKAPGGNLFVEERLLSDGHGRYRLDVKSGTSLLPQTIVNVLDTNTEQSTVWSEGANSEKAYGKHRCQTVDPVRMMAVPETYPKTADMQSLGARVINGHKCHGWKSTSFGSESWIDDDYACVVEGKAGAGSEPLTMVSWSTTPPDQSLFSPPADYIAIPTAVDGSGPYRHMRASRAFSDLRMHQRP
jgi:hypothetical protein